MITTTMKGGERRRPSSSNTRIQQQSRDRGVKQKKQNSTRVGSLQSKGPSLNLKPLKIAWSKMDHQGNRGSALWHKVIFFFF